jgi:hypothetical protein
LFEEVKFVSLFVSPRLPCETERSSSPSLKLKPCPSGHQNVVLSNGRESMSILHNISLENKNSMPWTSCLAPHCNYGDL